MVLLCCLEKLRRWIFWCLVSQLLVPRSFFRCRQRILLISRLCSKLQPRNAKHCLVWQQEHFHMAFQMGSQRWSILMAPDKSEQSSRAPATVFSAGWMRFSFELLNYKFPSWPSNRGGWEEGGAGTRKSCLANKMGVGGGSSWLARLSWLHSTELGAVGKSGRVWLPATWESSFGMPGSSNQPTIKQSDAMIRGSKK